MIKQTISDAVVWRFSSGQMHTSNFPLVGSQIFYILFRKRLWITGLSFPTSSLQQAL